MKQAKYYDEQKKQWIPFAIDGRTPVKGTDYFTEQDKAEMNQQVMASLNHKFSEIEGRLTGLETEGKYELIEKFELIETMDFSRTLEPDGTPYAFKSLKIIFKFGDENIPKNIYIQNKENKTVNFAYFYANAKQAIMRTSIQNGVSENLNLFSSSIGEMLNNILVPFKDEIVNINKITKIFSYGKVPAGSIVEIYAVRA